MRSFFFAGSVQTDGSGAGITILSLCKNMLMKDNYYHKFLGDSYNRVSSLPH